MKTTKEIKYSVQELLGVGFTLVVLGIGLAYGIDITADIRDDFAESGCAELRAANGTTQLWYYNSSSKRCYNSTDQTQAEVDPRTAEYNSTVDTITGLSKITEKIETIAVVVVASVIIGILVTYLWARFARM